MGWLYVPGLEVLSSECELPREETFVWSATSSGKPTRRPLSWRGWTTRPWIARLYGTILRPSTAERGAAWWIASLRASHANHIASQASRLGTRTSARSGRSSSGSLKNANQLSFSLRMSRHSSSTSSRSGAAYQAWASSSHRHYFKPRQRAGDLTSESGSLSLLPTPTARDWRSDHGTQS